MTFLQNLTDNQTAILGCVGLLAAAFVVMSASYHVGVIVRGGRTATERRRATPPVTASGIVQRRAA